MKPFHSVTASTSCHDIRHWKMCAICEGVADKRDTVNGSHGRCFIKKYGLKKFLALPKSETDKCRLSDIGERAMRALLNRS